MSEKKTVPLCQVERASLALVDLQTRLTAVMPAKVLARLQRNTGLLIRSAAALGVPVFVSEQYPEGLGRIEGDIEKLLPGDVHRYEKTVFSLASVDAFLKDLGETGRSQVVLAGMEAHICILQTALQLQERGYEVYVVADAVCSRHRESYETALERMRQAGVVICDAESVLFEWTRDAKHPEFKPLQALVT